MQTSVQPPERQIVRTFSPDSGMTRVLLSVNMDEPHELSVSRCQQQATPWHVCVRLLQSHCKLGRCTFRVQNAMLGERPRGARRHLLPCPLPYAGIFSPRLGRHLQACIGLYPSACE